MGALYLKIRVGLCAVSDAVSGTLSVVVFVLYCSCMFQECQF